MTTEDEIGKSKFEIRTDIPVTEHWRWGALRRLARICNPCLLKTSVDAVDFVQYHCNDYVWMQERTKQNLCEALPELCVTLRYSSQLLRGVTPRTAKLR